MTGDPPNSISAIFNLCDPNQAPGFAAWFPELYRTEEKTMNLMPDVLRMNDGMRVTRAPTTLRFRAENFEAEATQVGPRQYVVTAGGASPKTLMHEVGLGTSKMDTVKNIHLLTDAGWTWLCSASNGNALDLALAISLLYSVPGVEVVE